MLCLVADESCLGSETNKSLSWEGRPLLYRVSVEGESSDSFEEAEGRVRKA